MATGILAFCGACAICTPARAQQTVFNVPSADVLTRGARYVETDHYLRRKSDAGTSPGFCLVRGVLGLGRGVEAGLNLGGFEYGQESQPFLDGAIKWRPIERDFGGLETTGRVGIVTGSQLGIGLRGEPRGQVRDLTYAATYVTLPKSKTRLSAGAYFATREVFTSEDRVGAQLTFEQPIPSVNGLVAATDWYSGDGGAATAGLIWTVSRFIAYAGYGLANTGRAGDLATLEIGVTL
jgi:hypothetical protein